MMFSDRDMIPSDSTVCSMKMGGVIMVVLLLLAVLLVYSMGLTFLSYFPHDVLRYCFIAAVLLVLIIFAVWLCKKLIEWKNDNSDTVLDVVLKVMPYVCAVLALAVAVTLKLFSFSVFIIPVFIVCAFYAVKYAVRKIKDGQCNMMITVNRPEGDFRNEWVFRNSGTEIWCQSYDKDNHGMLFRRVTENKKGNEGHVTLEFGAKSAKLFEWDGNKELLDKKSRTGSYKYDSPEFDIPINASIIKEVKF